MKWIVPLICSVFLTWNAANAQTFPSRPVTVIVSVSSGSATDALMRLLGDWASKIWGVPVVIKNVTGANGIVGTQEAVRSAPDGYTLFATATNIVTNSVLYKNLDFDTEKSLKAVARLTATPMALCVSNKVAANSITELSEASRKSADPLHLGTAGTGSFGHFVLIMIAQQSGAKVTHVPYKTIAQAQTDLTGAHIDGAFVVPSAAAQMMQTGKVRCIGVSSQARVPVLPSTPSFSEAFPGFDVTSWIGLSAPSGTPDDIVEQISATFMKIMQEPEVQAKIDGMGQVRVPMPFREFRPFLASEFEVWRDLIRKNNITID